MDKLRDRFAALDRMPVPDVWNDAVQRAASMPVPVVPSARVALTSPTAGAHSRSAAGRLVAVLATVALILALAVGGLAVGSWYLDQQRLAPIVAPSPTATLPDASPRSPAPSTAPAGAASPWVVFQRHVVGERSAFDLWAIRADGSGAQQLSSSMESVAWSQDGRRLLGVHDYRVYIAEVTDDGIGPFVDTGFDTGGAKACNKKSARRNPCQDAAFAFAPDGEHVAFIQRCTHSAPGCMFITTLDLRTGKRTELSSTQRNARHPLALPAWSPDGSSIAFTRETDQRVLSRGGTPVSNLYIVGADGRNLRKLDLGGLSVTAPQWSLDGTSIAFASEIWHGEANLERNIYTIQADGTGLRQLTTDGASAWPQWTSPNQIRFRHGVAGPQSVVYWVMNADGSNVAELVDLGASWGEVAHEIGWLYFPGDPGRSLFWQPTP
ncbi:MAG: hypothetical protein ABWY52_00250 [Candidatus Limnocylindrales bacterium]